MKQIPPCNNNGTTVCSKYGRIGKDCIDDDEGPSVETEAKVSAIL